MDKEQPKEGQCQIDFFQVGGFKTVHCPLWGNIDKAMPVDLTDCMTCSAYRGSYTQSIGHVKVRCRRYELEKLAIENMRESDD